jgi:GTP-binding protein HflX
MGQVRERTIYFGNQQRKTSKSLENVYEAVRHIHITRFPYNKFCTQTKDAIEKK